MSPTRDILLIPALHAGRESNFYEKRFKNLWNFWVILYDSAVLFRHTNDAHVCAWWKKKLGEIIQRRYERVCDTLRAKHPREKLSLVYPLGIPGDR